MLILIVIKKSLTDAKEEKNPRNMVVGAILAKDSYNPKLVKKFSFIAYQILNKIYKKNKQLKKLKKMGFETVTYKEIEEIEEQDMKEYLTERDISSDYLIDGIVIDDNSEKYELTNDKCPKNAIAFKMNNINGVVTEVLDIIWTPSRQGKLKPVIIIKTIEIDGARINKATGNNASFIIKNKIGVGSIIEVIRSGKIIPKVHKVITPTKVKLPSIDPEDYEYNDVDFILKNINDDDRVIIKKIHSFFKILECKTLGEKTIEKMFYEGYDTLQKILLAEYKDLEKISGLGKTSSKKIVNSIKESIKNVPLEKVLSASNIFEGFAEKKFILILDTYPNIIDMYVEFKKDSLELEESQEKIKELLTGIKGLKTTINVFVKGIEKFLIFLDEHPMISIRGRDENKEERKTGIFSDKFITMTGFRNKDLEKKIVEEGGEVINFGKKTNYLIIKNSSYTNKKIEKAECEVLTLEEFLEKFGITEE